MDIKDYISSGIIQLYVMGLCSREEEKELELLRNQYPELQKAIFDYEVELEKKILKTSISPSADIDQKILNQIDKLGKAPVIPISKQIPVKKISWLKPVAAAAILLFGISAFFNFKQYQKNEKLAALVKSESGSPLPLADYTVITNPSITPVAMYGQGSHAICRCTMFWDKKKGKAYIMIHHLPKSSETKDYQLWAQVDGKQVSVGIINDGIRGRLVEVQGVPANSIAFSVTLEQAGGATTPTEAELYLAGKI